MSNFPSPDSQGLWLQTLPRQDASTEEILANVLLARAAFAGRPSFQRKPAA